MLTDAGLVASFGGLPYPGSLTKAPSRPIVGMASTHSEKGYWLAEANGAVLDLGDARSYGSLPTGASRKVVGVQATPDGNGYWLVAADGGVFGFGDARGYGSMAGHVLPSPVVGMAATPDGNGYRLVCSNGAVYAFGDATFLGGANSADLYAPIVGISTAPTGQGYWLLGADGGILSFGTAAFRGSAHGHVPSGQRVVAMVVGASTGQGAKSSGAFGPGSSSPGKAPPTPKPPAGNDPEIYPDGAKGYDISWPQCGSALPPRATVAVVGVNGGWAFTSNPCFASEARWAGGNLTTYINLNSPRGSASGWATGPAGKCAKGDLYCESYNYGYNTAKFSVRSAERNGTHSKTWWLDIETQSYWSSRQAANARVIGGAIAALKADGLKPAVYSTTYQWDVITGGYVPGTIAWYPTGIATSSPRRWCKQTSFAGGPVSLVQSANGRFDGDYSC
jgi:hypothetical protein